MEAKQLNERQPIALRGISAMVDGNREDMIKQLCPLLNEATARGVRILTEGEKQKAISIFEILSNQLGAVNVFNALDERQRKGIFSSSGLASVIQERGLKEVEHNSKQDDGAGKAILTTLMK